MSEYENALSRIDDELHGVNYELYVYLHDVISQAIELEADLRTRERTSQFHKSNHLAAEAVIADVRKLPDEWEEQDAQAQWPADVPNGSQCADDLRAALREVSYE